MKRSREPEENIEPHLQSGDTERFVAQDRPAAKITYLDSAVEDGDDDADSKSGHAVAMKCSLPPHQDPPLLFKSYADYEIHYSQTHTNRCLECRKNFPTDHLLGIHIEECHDSLIRVRRDKGEHTYSCFVEGCERKCSTHQKRRMHMIDKHLYPKNFFFAVTKEGIDGRRSLLNDGHQRRRSSAAAQIKETRRRASTLESTSSQPDQNPGTRQSDTKSKERSAPDTDMADLAGAMSALQFVPNNVRFGRGRAGFAKS